MRRRINKTEDALQERLEQQQDMLLKIGCIPSATFSNSLQYFGRTGEVFEKPRIIKTDKPLLPAHIKVPRFHRNVVLFPTMYIMRVTMSDSMRFQRCIVILCGLRCQILWNYCQAKETDILFCDKG